MIRENKVFLAGNLTRDPELRHTQSGKALASFGLAVNRKYKQGDETKEEVCFVDVVTWEKTAENAGKYLKKGSAIYLKGRLSYRTWDEEGTGKKRSKLEVVAQEIQYQSTGGKPVEETSPENKKSNVNERELETMPA